MVTSELSVLGWKLEMVKLSLIFYFLLSDMSDALSFQLVAPASFK